MDNIERLYKCYEVLSDAGDKVSEVSAIKNASKWTVLLCTYTHIHVHICIENKTRAGASWK